MYYFVAFIFCKAIHCEQSQLFHWMVLHLTDLKVEVTLRLMPFAVCWKNNDSYSWSVTGLNVYLDQIQYSKFGLLSITKIASFAWSKFCSHPWSSKTLMLHVFQVNIPLIPTVHKKANGWSRSVCWDLNHQRKTDILQCLSVYVKILFSYW
jgi:hypothetical protein